MDYLPAYHSVQQPRNLRRSIGFPLFSKERELVHTHPSRKRNARREGSHEITLCQIRRPR